VLVDCSAVVPATYRNFNLCPHCASLGQQTLLHRLSEGLPMISRSDGKSFHLVLADRPLPYPLEKSASHTKRISVCFWYNHVRRSACTLCCIVILSGTRINNSSLYRKIEQIADLLAEELGVEGNLADVYEYFEDTAAPAAIS
jgi:hypothetical protein